MVARLELERAPTAEARLAAPQQVTPPGCTLHCTDHAGGDVGRTASSPRSSPTHGVVCSRRFPYLHPVQLTHLVRLMGRASLSTLSTQAVQQAKTCFNTIVRLRFAAV